jgi:hypothetical protein
MVYPMGEANKGALRLDFDPPGTPPSVRPQANGGAEDSKIPPLQVSLRLSLGP